MFHKKVSRPRVCTDVRWRTCLDLSTHVSPEGLLLPEAGTVAADLQPFALGDVEVLVGDARIADADVIAAVAGALVGARSVTVVGSGSVVVADQLRRQLQGWS